MSQAGDISATSGPVPPSVATSYETQNGTAVPLLNNLIINGVDSFENNANGIIVEGGVVGTGTQNKVDVVLTNRQTNTGTTVGITPSNLITYNCGALAAVYNFNLQIVAYNATDSLGSGYSVTNLIVRTNGVTATIIGVPTIDISEESTMINVQFDIDTFGNNLSVDLVGLLAKTINWNSILTYIVIG